MRSTAERRGRSTARARPAPPCHPLGPTRSALAALLPRRRPTHPTSAPWPGRGALWVIAPDDVAIVIRRRDLDKAVPEFSAADVLFGLIAAYVALEHDVAVVRRPDHLPTVLGELVEEIRDLS